MDRIGCQEMEMPVVQPADLWRESGRYQKIGPELVRFKDRTGRDMVLAMTHEEVVATLLRDLVSSYRQLPLLVYHIQTKFRDEPRSRGGLIRVREFVMKDSYSCDIDTAGLDRSYQLHYEAYQRIFERLGLDAIPVGADVGMMGGSLAHEFMALNEHGEDTLVLCENGDYAANQQIATVRKPEAPPEEPMPTEEVATPGAATIADLARVLEVGEERTAKATFFMTGDGRLLTVITRGDYEVNETKLPIGAMYLGEDGERHPIVMGSYGIGIGRNVACIVEAHHDEKGIAWPAEVAPYPAHLVTIGAARDPQVASQADALYARLADAGVEILYDDRDESPGVKFTDAELLGMPLIVTLSPRSLAAGGVEVTERATGEKSVQPMADLEARLTTAAGG